MIRDSVIDVTNLSKTYQEGIVFRKRFEALRDVSLQVFRGEVFGLLGPNGAGKTTLIKILLGILHTTSGHATVLGEPAGSKDARRRIGYLPENLSFPRHHTGRDSLYFYGRLNCVSEADIRSREKNLLELVGLLGREREPVRKYSKGMRQRLGLAQAMMHDPDVLIMDEPTDGLDPVGRSQIRDVIDQLRKNGKTVFLNSHILQEVELVCDRVAIMAKGQIKGIGAIDELINQYQVKLQLTIRLELQGDTTAIRSALSPYGVRLLETPASDSPITAKTGNPARTDFPIGDLVAPLVVHSPTDQSASQDRYVVEVQVDSQTEVNHIVDTLRRDGISIWKLEPFRPRLEQVFMSMISNVAQPALPLLPITGRIETMADSHSIPSRPTLSSKS